MTARGGLYLCPPQSSCLSEDTVDGLLVCAMWEAHLRLTLLLGWTNTSRPPLLVPGQVPLSISKSLTLFAFSCHLII